MPLLQESVSHPIALKLRRTLDSTSKLRHFKANGVRTIPITTRETCAEN
jgi:hypothetical protein